MPRIPSEVAIEWQETRHFPRRDEAVDAGFLQSPRRRIFRLVNRTARRIDGRVWATRQRRKLQVVPISRDDVEWASGGDLQQRRPGPVTEYLAHKSAAPHSACLIYPAEHKAVALIEERSGTIHPRVITILRRQRRLQIRRVVNRVRVRVRGQEFVVPP